MKIFVVDDDNEIIQLMTTVLNDSGHEVMSCVAGHEAISQVAEFRPDCIVSDLMMATMDGLEFCDEIRKQKKFNKIKIIMVSARDADHWREKALERGANGYITKPIDIMTFASQLEEIVAAEN